jgi:hypothetical protein
MFQIRSCVFQRLRPACGSNFFLYKYHSVCVVLLIQHLLYGLPDVLSRVSSRRIHSEHLKAGRLLCDNLKENTVVNRLNSLKFLISLRFNSLLNQQRQIILKRHAMAKNKSVFWLFCMVALMMSVVLVDSQTFFTNGRYGKRSDLRTRGNRVSEN